jgi:hypothetical protein
MKKNPKIKSDYHLRVYEDRSELIVPGLNPVIFEEGELSAPATERYAKIVAQLESGFLEKTLLDSKKSKAVPEIGMKASIDGLIGEVTSEVGRALVALLYLQLVIKTIEPKQSIRLHKGSGRRTGFGWKEGLPMRTIDSNFVTPFLRKSELLKLNKFGLFMTRSLAENYPYSRVYKAESRGGKEQWLDAIDLLESGKTNPRVALLYMTSQLSGGAKEFASQAEEVMNIYQKKQVEIRTIDRASELLVSHMKSSDYAARIMEISMHALMQALSDLHYLGDLELVPLSQMRSANKKHGNVGDIELKLGSRIVEAWDAKYEKDYLREEIDELVDKLMDHESVKRAGFVTSRPVRRFPEIDKKTLEVREATGTEIEICTFTDWAKDQASRAKQHGAKAEQSLARQWVLAYIETLSLRRTEIAPIDEPSIVWLKTFKTVLSKA